MPIHDWTKVSSGIFHAFHVAWIGEIQKSLNSGRLPDGYYALAEQVASKMVPDVLTLRQPALPSKASLPITEQSGGGIAVVAEPPRMAITETLKFSSTPLVPQRRISIRHVSDDRVVAILEIVSPGNKDKTFAVEQFVDKAVVAFGEGIHIVTIDLFPPGKLDPCGLHALIWSRLGGSEYIPPKGRPLTLAAYNAGTATCYVEPTAPGSALVDPPLFLTSQTRVNAPLEQTYMAAYEGLPSRWKQVIESR